ncbi:hypothetical protein LR48_Vigan01g062300 [Vigna angularis]|uniref:Uncharacterized protein n=1 Tax=Phaseolus angularis TaxID=3914 RepID=A0A0L9TKE8_PHAAN|nr:hypothetical protein LR48_Vigan01g062300 [Vigna angularis]
MLSERGAERGSMSYDLAFDYEMKGQDLGLNQEAYDESTMPLSKVDSNSFDLSTHTRNSDIGKGFNQTDKVVRVSVHVFDAFLTV